MRDGEFPSIVSGKSVWLSITDSFSAVVHNLNSSTLPLNVEPPIDI